MSEKKIQVNLLVFRLAMLRMRKDNDEIMRLSQELEKRLRTSRVRR